MTRIWMPDGYTEAHRTLDRQCELIAELAACGLTVDSGTGPIVRPDVVVCGSLFQANHVRKVNRVWKCPVVQYNWDLYPWVVENRKGMGWDAYLKDLKGAAKILVPNTGTALRTKEMTGREDAVVVRAPVKVWDVPPRPDGTPEPRSYVLDVMRDYPWDKGHEYPEKACKKLGVTLVRTKTGESWDRFRWLVANAACLVSAVDEASTGGLTLLEGYAHGVPVVISYSPLNGANEYFDEPYGKVERGWRFDHGDGVNDLVETVKLVMGTRNREPVDECRRWVETTYSDARFAAAIAHEVKLCLTN